MHGYIKLDVQLNQKEIGLLLLALLDAANQDEHKSEDGCLLEKLKRSLADVKPATKRAISAPTP